MKGFLLALPFVPDDPGIADSGRRGVLMYKTSTDLWAWMTWQP
ncbi:MAG TPA: hypothetical protein VFZ95_07600 [Steroidobacteraceae bacterium]